MARTTDKGTVVKLVGKVDAAKYVKEKGYPEVGQFADTKSLQKFYKQLSMENLKGWVELEGLTVKPTDSEPIYRMRLAMAILYKHFPKETSSKPESPYKQYTLEQLVTMAIDNNVPVEATDDDRILRMRTIMALRAHKVL